MEVGHLPAVDQLRSRDVATNSVTRLISTFPSSPATSRRILSLQNFAPSELESRRPHSSHGNSQPTENKMNVALRYLYIAVGFGSGNQVRLREPIPSVSVLPN